MINNFYMPEKLEDADITVIKRNSNYDDDLWLMLEKHRIFLGKYLNWPNRIKSIEGLNEETDKEISRWDTGERYYYYILHNDRLVGGIYLLNIDYKHHSAEWGYWLNPDETGKGYVSKALNILEKVIFEQNIVRIVIRCDIENEASANVAIRNGYDFEGVLKRSFNNQGRFADNKIFAKINPNY